MLNRFHFLFLTIALSCLASASCAYELKPVDANRSVDKTTWTLNDSKIILFEPDSRDKPITWQGPLKISNKAGSKIYELNLISNLYVVDNSLFVLSYSGNQYFLDMFDIQKQLHLVKEQKISSSNIEIDKNHVSVLPACECVENNSCECNAGQVFNWNSSGINYDKKLSRKLTRKILGVEFEGTKSLPESSIKK